MEDDMTRAAAAVQAADADVATARDDLRRATSSHEIAHLSYTRIEDVNKQEAGLVPRQDIDVVHSRDLESEAQLAMTQSRLRVRRTTQSDGRIGAGASADHAEVHANRGPFFRASSLSGTRTRVP